MFKDFDIDYYSVQAGDKHMVGKVERLNRTIKGRLTKQMTDRGHPIWFDILDDIIYNYNHSVHSSIQQTPISVTLADEQRIIQSEMIKTQMILNSRDTLEIGDSVRLPLTKKIFDKGEPTYSSTVHTIQEINPFGNSVRVSGKTKTYKYHMLQKVKP